MGQEILNEIKDLIDSDNISAQSMVGVRLEVSQAIKKLAKYKRLTMSEAIKELIYMSLDSELNKHKPL